MEDVSRQNSGSTNHKQLFHRRTFDWSCELPFCLQFLAGLAWARSLQMRTPQKSLDICSLPPDTDSSSLTWRSIPDSKFFKHLSFRDVFMLIYMDVLVWNIKNYTKGHEFWICHQYQTHREIKEIGNVCLQIYKVMAYLKIWIEVLDSSKHMSCWVAIYYSCGPLRWCLQETHTRR